jgi:hypothetical protein
MLFDGRERRVGAYEYCNILPGLYPRDWVILLDMFSYRVVITTISLPCCNYSSFTSNNTVIYLPFKEREEKKRAFQLGKVQEKQINF